MWQTHRIYIRCVCYFCNNGHHQLFAIDVFLKDGLGKTEREFREVICNGSQVTQQFFMSDIYISLVKSVVIACTYT